MTTRLPLSDEEAAEIHNRLVAEIVERLVHGPIEQGGSMSDVMMLCESVLVGVALKCFELGGDVKVLDIILARAKDRLSKIRLGPIETQGNG